MKHSFRAAVLLSLTCLFFTAVPQKSVAAAQVDDPFLCLEEIGEPRALAWARAENDKTLGMLQSDPRNRRFYEEARSILQAKDRISYVSLERRGLSNFSQDENHVRGIWRRTTLDSYRGQDPHWETIIDIDALAVADKKNWVFKGASCLPPEERLCLVHFSDGGKDAVRVREFDLDTNAFVTTGFALSDGKQAVSWVERHAVLIARDWGEGTLTQVGYPFVLKELKRPQPLVRAREVFRGEPTDAVAAPFVLRDNEGKVHAAGAMRAISFVQQEYVLFGPNAPIKLNLPKKANISGVVSGRLLVTLDEDWILSGSTRFAAGSMISYGLGKWNKDPLRGMPSLVFQPEPRRALSGFPVTKNLLMASPDNVQSKAFIYRYDQGTWRATPIPLPTNENVSLSAASEETDVVLFTVSNYLEPTPLWYFDAASEGLETLRTTPRPLQRSDRAGVAVRHVSFHQVGRRLLLHRRIWRSRHPSSAGGSRPTHPIRSLSRARPTQTPSFSLPPRATAGMRRTAAARRAALGQSYYCYENIDGGHSAAAISRDTRAGWHSNTPMHPGGLWIECG